MKKFLALIIVLFCTNAVFSQTSFTVGDLTYEVINGQEMQVEVHDCNTTATSITIPETINGYTVTKIGNAAFLNCSTLVSVTIPNSVTLIDNNAFTNCSTLVSITIPNSVISIGGNAFQSCTSLASVNLPNNITIINGSTFDNCTSLTSIVIPNGVTAINGNAFYGCTSLTSVVIPASVTNIPGKAFYNCSSLKYVTCLRQAAPTIGDETFKNTPNTKVLCIPTNATGYTNATYKWNKTTWASVNKNIITSTYTINDNTTLSANSFLRIVQGGELINNRTNNNNLGIVEIETTVLPNNSWAFIGAPLNGANGKYKLESIIPGTRDVSISMFDYTIGTWSNNWATINTEVGAGEGFFVWSFANEAAAFTTYGDGIYSPNAVGYESELYNYNATPSYPLNNGDVTVTKSLTLNPNGGGYWMALANPYPFKLNVASFLGDNQGIQGGVSYRLIYNANNQPIWQTVSTGVINVTEGFFVNFGSGGSKTATFKKTQRHTSAKSSAQRDFIKIIMTEGENEMELLFTQNEDAEQGYDIFDANKLFSPAEITEHYFVTDETALIKEEVKTLPYYARMNVRSFANKTVSFKAANVPEEMAVSIIDGEEVIELSEGVVYVTNISAGENANRFKVLFGSSVGLEDVASELNAQITNNNRIVNIATIEKDLQIEVYNALGQKVYETKSHNFTLNNIPVGAYIIKAFNKSASKTTKIILNKK